MVLVIRVSKVIKILILPNTDWTLYFSRNGYLDLIKIHALEIGSGSDRMLIEIKGWNEGKCFIL